MNPNLSYGLKETFHYAYRFCSSEIQTAHRGSGLSLHLVIWNLTGGATWSLGWLYFWGLESPSSLLTSVSGAWNGITWRTGLWLSNGTWHLHGAWLLHSLVVLGCWMFCMVAQGSRRKYSSQQFKSYMPFYDPAS